MDDFILRALIAGILIAIATGSTGCFMVWKRMAYYGDSLSHCSLLGIALGIYFGIGASMGTLAICLCFTIILLLLQSNKSLSPDTMLGILAHGALSAGIILFSLIEYARLDIYTFLFGDILTITSRDAWWMGCITTTTIAIIYFNWKSFLLITLNEDLARADNINIKMKNIVLTILITLIIAISVRVAGVMLVTSLLIIPAATARQISSTPEWMAVQATLLGMISIILGICGSLTFNIPTAPTSVAISVLLFLSILTCKHLILHK